MQRDDKTGWAEPVISEMEYRLTNIVQPAIERMGLFLLELCLLGDSRGLVLRLYVDNNAPGVSLEECVQLSHQLSDLLDVEDIISEPYHLEVSSPGLNRKLRYAREFELLKGRRARLLLRQAGGNQYIIGYLRGKEDEEILLETEKELKRISLHDIIRAQLYPQIYNEAG
jgi:ribosome maturation factor RimP